MQRFPCPCSNRFWSITRLAAALGVAISAAPHSSRAESSAASTIRLATFNASLSRGQAGQIRRAIDSGDPQTAAVVEILQTVRPDVVLINELDWDADGAALAALRAALNSGDQALEYPYAFLRRSNTGAPTGLDIRGRGRAGGPMNAFGWGEFEGRYAMALLSRFPIQEDQARTFQLLKWADMPGNLMPQGHYTTEAAAILRVSSKSHWDVPVTLPDGRTVHVLASHPTPPVFDGPEDANGRRNHDEIRLITDYIDGADYISDDAGAAGGLDPEALFVVMGDLNNDPNDGDGRHEATQRLLAHPRVQDPRPTSAGALEAAQTQGGANARHRTAPETDTADWRDRGRSGPGNLRVDYVLPSIGLEVVGAQVFWPAKADPLRRLIEKPNGRPASSDHRLVAVDVRLQ